MGLEIGVEKCNCIFCVRYFSNMMPYASNNIPRLCYNVIIIGHAHLTHDSSPMAYLFYWNKNVYVAIGSSFDGQSKFLVSS